MCNTGSRTIGYLNRAIDIDKVESLIERERPKKSQKTSALLPEMKTPSALDGAEDVERWKREIIGSLDDLPPDMIEFLAGQIATIKSRREKYLRWSICRAPHREEGSSWELGPENKPNASLKI